MGSSARTKSTRRRKRARRGFERVALRQTAARHSLTQKEVAAIMMTYHRARIYGHPGAEDLTDPVDAERWIVRMDEQLKELLFLVHKCMGSLGLE